jgi:creatinine amidohydrolase
VVPAAAIEQHGPHQPVMVDSLLTCEVARRAALRAQRRTLVTPPVWLGLSEHHMPLGGTLSTDLDTFRGALRHVVTSLARHGVGRVLLLNGHGGNEGAMRVVVDELSPIIGIALVQATYWRLAQPAFAGILERQQGVGHACEAETAMMLVLRPELVRQDRLPAERPEAGIGGAIAPAQRWRSFATTTTDGVRGHPEAASREKGERLLEAAANAVAGLLDDAAMWDGGSG